MHVHENKGEIFHILIVVKWTVVKCLCRATRSEWKDTSAFCSENGRLLYCTLATVKFGHLINLFLTRYFKINISTFFSKSSLLILFTFVIVSFINFSLRKSLSLIMT